MDKNLRYHGLIQAFSRTNRILNSVKTFGNIVSFRDLEDETNDAISRFGNKDARSVVLVKSYAEHLAEYQTAVNSLFEDFPLGPDGSVPVIDSEKEQKSFIVLFSGILRLHNILTSFDKFVDPETSDNPLSPRMMQDYQSLYLDLYQQRRSQERAEHEAIDEDVVFEIELIKQVEINVDYILMLVEKHRQEKGDGDDKELRSEISRAVDASPSLRNKKDLVEAVVDSISTQKDAEVDTAWRQFIEGRKNAELDEIIEGERLRDEPAKKFVEQALRDGQLRTSGTEIVEILPRLSRFAKNQDQSLDGVKQRVITKLTAFFERFFDLVVSGEDR